MTHVIELTDEEYATLETIAQHQGVTPQAYVDLLTEQLRQPRPIYDNLDDFFRSLGASDEEIARMNASTDDGTPAHAPADAPMAERKLRQA